MKKFLQRLRVAKKTGTQSFASNGFWILLEKTVRLVTSLISNIWLARYLQPFQYGILTYATVFVSLFTNLTSLGLRDIVLREYITHKENSHQGKALNDAVLNTAITLRLTASLIAIFLIAIYINSAINNELEKSILYIALFGLLFKVSEVFEYPFEAAIDTKLISIVKIITWLLKASILIGLIYLNQSIYALTAIVSYESLILLLFCLAIYKQKKYVLQPLKLFSKAQALSLLHDSWPLMISGLAIIIYMRADQIMLKAMVGNYEVGIYSAAAQLVEAIYIFPVAIINSVQPKLIEAKLQGERVLREKQQKLYDITVLVSYGIILCTLLFSNLAVSYIYGDSYHEASLILSLLAWSILAVNLGVARSSFFVIENCPRIKLQIVLLSCLLNIGLNFGLIPLFSGIGAAISTLISYYFAVFAACFLWPKLRPTGYMFLKALWPMRLFQPK